MMLKITKFKTKKHGWVTWEIMLGVILVLVLIGGMVYKFPEIRNSTNRSAAFQDMQTIRTLVISYAGFRKDGRPPATLETLATSPSISADEAVDGADHGAFLDLSKRSTSSGQILDPWGNEYEYTVNSDGSGSIISTGGGMADSSDLVVEF